MNRIIVVVDCETEALEDVVVDDNTAYEVLIQPSGDTEMEPEVLEPTASPQYVKDVFKKFAKQKENKIIAEAVRIKQNYTEKELNLFKKYLDGKTEAKKK